MTKVATAIARLEKYVARLREQIRELKKCPHCHTKEHNQWHVLAECPHPKLIEVRTSVANDLRALAQQLFDPEGLCPSRRRSLPPTIAGWQEWFHMEDGKWIWPESERDRRFDSHAGWETCQWLGLWHRSYLDNWVQRCGDEVAAANWFKTTSKMQKLGKLAIEGCGRLWKLAKGMRMKGEASKRTLPTPRDLGSHSQGGDEGPGSVRRERESLKIREAELFKRELRKQLNDPTWGLLLDTEDVLAEKRRRALYALLWKHQPAPQVTPGPTGMKAGQRRKVPKTRNRRLPGRGGRPELVAAGGVKIEWTVRRAPAGVRQPKAESVYYQAMLAEDDRREMSIEKAGSKAEWRAIQASFRQLQEVLKWSGMAEAPRRPGWPEIWKHWSSLRVLFKGSGLALDEKQVSNALWKVLSVMGELARARPRLVERTTSVWTTQPLAVAVRWGLPTKEEFLGSLRVSLTGADEALVELQRAAGWTLGGILESERLSVGRWDKIKLQAHMSINNKLPKTNISRAENKDERELRLNRVLARLCEQGDILTRPRTPWEMRRAALWRLRLLSGELAEWWNGCMEGSTSHLIAAFVTAQEWWTGVAGRQEGRLSVAQVESEASEMILPTLKWLEYAREAKERGCEAARKDAALGPTSKNRAAWGAKKAREQLAEQAGELRRSVRVHHRKDEAPERDKVWDPGKARG